MAILELLVRQAYFGQQLINRFHYVSSGTPAAVSLSYALTYAFGVVDTAGTYPATAPFSVWRSSVIPQLTFIETEAKNLYSPTDFYTRPWTTPLAGTNVGEAASPVLAYGLRSSRVRTDIRRGFKRIGGVNESWVDAGGVLNATAVTQWSTFATRISQVLSFNDEGNTITFSPVVLGYEEYTTPSGRSAYRPYATESAQLDHAALGIVYSVMPNIRSQVSRQYGRGT